MLSAPLAIPVEEFDGYKLLRLIGRGRMGQVYLAHDTLLDRQVAVKFIASLQPDPKERERFFIEARAIARLQHPNVVTIHRVGDVGGRPYLISEYVRGEGLDAMRKPLESQQALRIGRGLARGLAVAHRQGVLHRDIKPANAILSEDGEAKLLDFGLAKLLDRARTAGPAAPVMAADLPLSGGVAETLDPLVGAGETLTSAPMPETTASSPGAVLGTPLYIAPEVWEGEPATFRADVYSLGALLYELCSGRPPHDEPTIAAVRQAALTRAVRPLAEICDIEPRFAAIIHRCLHRNPGERPASGEELRDALEQLGTDRRLIPVSDENPYQGLRAFQAKHRALFFGRDAVVRTLVERLRSENFLLVAGDSGVGKSSVCRAGVLPALEDGALEDGRTWSSATVVPGHRPLASLAAALAPLAGRDEAELARRLADDAGEVARDLRRTMGSGRGLVLFVDQLEELVTLSDPAQAADASRALSWLAEAGAGLRVIATLRTDFLSRLAAFSGLGDGLARALYLVRPMTPEAIREAIVGPAQALGVRFESEALVATLVDSTASTEGGLPLAQFTLAALWEGRERESRTIRASALAALGGVAGALSRHADTVIDGLVPEQRDEARRIFLELVTPERTRGRRTEEELASQGPAAKAALDALVRGRLLVATGGSAYEVAHEALIQGWPTLRRWLDETVDQRQVRARLATSVAEWERLGRIRELLWRAPQLAETARLDLDELPPREMRFIESSRQGVLRGRLVRAGAAVAVGAAVALIAGGIWFRARRDMNAQVDARGDAGRVLLSGARDKAAERDRLRTHAFALFDAGDAVQGERVWAASLHAQSDSDRQYAQAGQELETALSLDAGRLELRRLLALVLFERATAAEQAGQLREELVHRLVLYDDGSLRERWEAQGQLAFSGAPQGATLTLERLGYGGGHAERLIDAADVPAKPLALDPGSYLLIFRAPGRAEVRAPVLLARGETLSVPVELPPAARVPAGLVFVPAGRFLFGSAEESLRRGFLKTAPLHSKSTGAFLIARNETTFGDWIEFLRDLPPRERELRLPRVAKSGFTGALELKALPGGSWRLKFQPASQAYSARAGELVVYQGRSSGAAQDWLRFPVSGISWDDARAYAAWLKRTGRVPSARLCDEAEWERAARGADGREFPSGSDLLPGDANFDETYGKQPLSFGPDAVGSHPESRSPFGLDDMAGNAWEWTTSALASGQRVVRGGSFYHDRNSSRTTNREVPEQTLRDLTVGMRVCAGWQ